MRVECPECHEMVKLPSGLKFTSVGQNPAAKGVSCPFCPGTIPAEKVDESTHA